LIVIVVAAFTTTFASVSLPAGAPFGEAAWLQV
jgi:hypothetical protein